MCHPDTQKHGSSTKWYKKHKYFANRLAQNFSDAFQPTGENF